MIRLFSVFIAPAVALVLAARGIHTDPAGALALALLMWPVLLMSAVVAYPAEVLRIVDAWRTAARPAGPGLSGDVWTSGRPDVTVIGGYAEEVQHHV